MRILLIENDEAIGSAVQYRMIADGHEIDWVKTLSEARKHECTGSYEMILLDNSLPDGNGIDYLRNRRRLNSAPTIVMTSHTEISDRIKVLGAGADDYMGKPFSMNELSARIGAAVCKLEYLRHRAFEIAGLIIVPCDRRLSRDGRAVDLTAAEWSVLDCLLEQPGALVSDDTIVDALCSLDSEIGSNVAELYICRLQKKIGERQIETIPGLGYRLVLS
ncbi:response regulator transcription factor [Rhizobium leguminosarum bv. viciae]|uniref:response regulator transcription factor n=1 Tax=Rhizobium TaxID=379 RepID=UPI00098F3688|nr:MULTISPECIES: response regulator transcription factor [Rhizobium]AVC52572.1 transcriptional regulatory, C terminal family protein [Rhizobium leguminosarum bv. viciae]MBB4346272.1 two-component system OmpR family response regulator [Rhizobium leguminosarum]MBB5262894.1 two-component system OmpR family response regulator [Rhizobium leguminosarum]MBB6299390.1 two-component system OmpR family response regulator [Rhizobium leguminosarum]MBX5069138.1 response regulator transcription factor [Rhizo